MYLIKIKCHKYAYKVQEMQPIKKCKFAGYYHQVTNNQSLQKHIHIWPHKVYHHYVQEEKATSFRQQFFSSSMKFP